MLLTRKDLNDSVAPIATGSSQKLGKTAYSVINSLTESKVERQF